MKYFEKKYNGYDLKYMFKPGDWMDETELKDLKGALDLVNLQSGRNLDYAVFDPKASWDQTVEFFKRSNFCLILQNKKACGFFYNYILQEKPFPAIHAGLVMINKNSGIDLLALPYTYMTISQYWKFGKYFYTNISSTPSLIGIFINNFGRAWPSYKSNILKPPTSMYRKVLDLLGKEYIYRFFPKEQVEIDSKRFVLRSPQQEMGFEVNFRKLPRYKDFMANLFSQYWLDYSKGEDMVQVGQIDFWVCLKGIKNIFFDLIKNKFNRQDIELPNKNKMPIPVLNSIQGTKYKDELYGIPKGNAEVKSENTTLV